SLGLLDTDEEWDQCLREATAWQTGHQLRRLFVLILLNCRPTDPLLLWNNHAEHLSDDCRYKLQTQYGIQEPTDDQVSSLSRYSMGGRQHVRDSQVPFKLTRSLQAKSKLKTLWLI